MILGDVVSDEVDPTDVVSLAFKELEENMEHLLVTAGDFELQAGMVELIFRLIPCETRNKRAQDYFSINSVSQAFSDITSPEFESGCRIFLNTLNQSQKEKRSVASIPCHSASFGRTEVHQPRDEKIEDFWVDFNFESKSISLFVEEKDQEGNYKEGSSWETVLIKAENVEDYRLKGTNNGDFALLLKLKHAASDLVTFASDDTCSQYVKLSFDARYASNLTSVSGKIFGNPNIQNTGGDSDVSSTPSTKASVAINPVHIKSSNTEMAYVMPTASVMSQAAKNVSDNLDKMQTFNELQNESVQDPPMEIEVPESKELNEDVKMKRNPLKRTSKRLQTRTAQSKKDQRKDDSKKEHDISKNDSSEKSLPSAFNVSKRLATSSKGKSVRKPLANAAKSRKAIREKVFSKGQYTHPLLESEQKSKENYTKFHMVTPARRREPRSGGVQGKRTKEDNDVNKDKSVDIVQDSSPLDDSMEGESDPNHQDKTKSNQGFSLKKRKVGKKGSEQNTESILESTAYDNHMTQKAKQRKKTRVQVTKSAGNKRSTGRTLLSKKAKQQLHLVRAPVHDENEPDISNDDGSDKQDEPYLEVYEGGGYVTECYIEEASPVYRSTPVTKTPNPGVESDENSEEEKTPLKLWLSESTSAGEAPRNNFENSEGSDVSEQGEEKEEIEEDFDSVHSEFENEIHHFSYSVSQNDSGIGETPFVKRPISNKRSWKRKPLQMYITPRSQQLEEMDQDEDNPEVVEDKRPRRKRKFVEWSQSGPNSLGTRITEQEPAHVNEAHLLSHRGQNIGKPRKLSYEDASTPYNQQEPEEGISDDEEIRREVQGLMNIVGSEIIKAVRKKRRMIRSFFQKANDMMSSSIDSFWDETQATSYNTLEKYRSQLSEQVKGLGKQLDKTSSILEGMEETFNTVAKQFKILKSQRQVNEKRLKGIQHLQGLMETEHTKLERKRNEQEATLRTEMENEMLKLQNKFLKDTCKQKEVELKMILNTFRIP